MFGTADLVPTTLGWVSDAANLARRGSKVTRNYKYQFTRLAVNIKMNVKIKLRPKMAAKTISYGIFYHSCVQFGASSLIQQLFVRAVFRRNSRVTCRGKSAA